MKLLEQNSDGAIDMLLKNAVTTAKDILTPILKTAKNCIDATVGNGNDTLFLASQSSKDTMIWGFDIQETAIEKTRKLLIKHDYLDKTKLIQDSHENIALYVKQPIDVAMYNLGYLPGSNRAIITSPESTLNSLRSILTLLNVGGIITIVTYPGFEAGRKEQLIVEGFLQTLSQHSFTVALWQTLNQINNPPVLYLIEKRIRAPI